MSSYKVLSEIYDYDTRYQRYLDSLTRWMRFLIVVELIPIYTTLTNNSVLPDHVQSS